MASQASEVTQTATAISCAATGYTSRNALEFSISCNQDQAYVGDIDRAGADNVEQCMEQCSVHSDHLCGAVAFDSNQFKCFFKNSSVTAQGAVTRNGWILAIANATKLEPISTECTSNGKNITTQNGLAFTVLCDQNVGELDSCPDTSPGCRSHTESLQDCVELCSTMHPLCTGVTWDSSLAAGYQNCYPKNGTVRIFDTVRAFKKGLRFAKALLEVYTDDCRSNANGTVIASNQDVFKLSCNEDRLGNNMTVHHAGSYKDCIDSCAAYSNASCLGAVFDAKMVNGYENCYLKSAIALPTLNQDGFVFALRQDEPRNSSNVPQQGHENKSKAWIAGPGVGGVAVTALILAALWWQQKKKKKEKEKRKRHSTSPSAIWPKPELDFRTEVPRKYELSSAPRVHELDVPIPELESQDHGPSVEQS